MKANSIQQEVLLMTNSSFAQRQWCKKEFEDANKDVTPEENIEELCANGLIQHLLPEVFNSDLQHKLYLWQMHPGFSFLQLELGEFPVAVQKEFSLDPHNFLPTAWYN